MFEYIWTLGRRIMTKNSPRVGVSSICGRVGAYVKSTFT